MKKIINPYNPINWSAPLNRGLVSRWQYFPNFNNSGPILYDLARDNHGILINRPQFDNNLRRPGGFGSMTFVGASAQYITTTVPQIDNVIACTMSMWMKRISIGTTCAVCFDSRAGINHYADNNIYFIASGGVDYGIISNTSSEWQLYTYVFDGSLSGNARLSGYVNDVAQSLTYSGTQPSEFGDQANLNIGLDPPALYSTGNIDDVRIYNRALSAEEVFRLYKDSLLGSPTTLNYLTFTKYFLPISGPLFTGPLTTTPFKSFIRGTK